MSWLRRAAKIYYLLLDGVKMEETSDLRYLQLMKLNWESKGHQVTIHDKADDTEKRV